jgi:hypothetical protein
MTKWEYKVVPDMSYMTFEAINKYLNEHGNEGWELIQITETALVFKRPIVERSVQHDLGPC